MPEIIQSICILDDDSSVLSSLQQLLDSDGFAARTFDNPDRFLAYAQEHAVTLVLLDVWMPGTNGIEVQERLHEFSPGTRVIVMTGRDKQEFEPLPWKAERLHFWSSLSTMRPF